MSSSVVSMVVPNMSYPLSGTQLVRAYKLSGKFGHRWPQCLTPDQITTGTITPGQIREEMSYLRGIKIESPRIKHDFPKVKSGGVVFHSSKKNLVRWEIEPDGKTFIWVNSSNGGTLHAIVGSHELLVFRVPDMDRKARPRLELFGRALMCLLPPEEVHGRLSHFCDLRKPLDLGFSGYQESAEY